MSDGFGRTSILLILIVVIVSIIYAIISIWYTGKYRKLSTVQTADEAKAIAKDLNMVWIFSCVVLAAMLLVLVIIIGWLMMPYFRGRSTMENRVLVQGAYDSSSFPQAQVISTPAPPVPTPMVTVGTGIPAQLGTGQTVMFPGGTEFIPVKSGPKIFGDSRL